MRSSHCNTVRPLLLSMGRKSKHKKASRRNAAEAAKRLIGLPPTLASVQTLQSGSEPHSNLADDVLTLHPDFADADSAQMAFDKAVFEKITGVTLLRHPYPSELDLKAVYEAEYGVGATDGLVLLLDVSCPVPSQFGMRTKIPTAVGPKDNLYKQLSQGYCAIIGEHGRNGIFYGLLHQRLPIEIVESGVIPVTTSVN